VSDWLASPLVLRRVYAARANAGWVRPAFMLDGVNLLRFVSLHGDNVADSESHIILQEGGVGYDAGRIHVDLETGTTNAVDPIRWEQQTERQLTGLWWVIGEINLGQAGFGVLEVGFQKLMDHGRDRWAGVRRLVSGSSARYR